MFWTIQEELLLGPLVAAGKSAGEIAAQMGVSRGAVMGKIRRLGLKGPRSRGAYKPKKPRTRRAKHALVYQPGTRLAPKQCDVGIHPDAPPSHKIKIADLEYHHCKWIDGDPAHAEYCGHHAYDGRYCGFHSKLVYQGGRR